mgnify:CR=1 FL=1
MNYKVLTLAGLFSLQSAAFASSCVDHIYNNTPFTLTATTYAKTGGLTVDVKNGDSSCTSNCPVVPEDSTAIEYTFSNGIGGGIGQGSVTISGTNTKYSNDVGDDDGGGDNCPTYDHDDQKIKGDFTDSNGLTFPITLQYDTPSNGDITINSDLGNFTVIKILTFTEDGNVGNVLEVFAESPKAI